MKKINFNTFITIIKTNLLIPILVILLMIGIFIQDMPALLEGLQSIFTNPSVLITDYMVIGGLGPAITNAAIVGLSGILVIKLNKLPMNGVAIAVILMMFGFGMFGKNALSIWPIIYGSYLYSKAKGVRFRNHVYPALFGTSLAPLITQAIYGFGWHVLIGVILGIIAGFLIPSIAVQVLQVHQGYNLYNIGFTAGIIGLLFTSVFRLYGFQVTPVLFWSVAYSDILRIACIVLFVLMIIFAFVFDGSSFRFYRKSKDEVSYLKLLKDSGRLRSDFYEKYGFSHTWFNMGLMGLICVGYMELTQSAYNGPTVGTILTVVGFGAYGKHPVNCIPIFIGVWLATLLPGSIFSANAPVAILGALFGTTLAPLSGQFGPFIGLVAGFLHIAITANVSYVHGGINLYNNGFAGGFVAIILVAIIYGFAKRIDYLKYEVD